MPLTTANNGSSEMCTGKPVLFRICKSISFNIAPPPVKIIPKSIISEACSGGVLSKALLIAFVIWTVPVFLGIDKYKGYNVRGSWFQDHSKGKY